MGNLHLLAKEGGKDAEQADEPDLCLHATLNCDLFLLGSSSSSFHVFFRGAEECSV